MRILRSFGAIAALALALSLSTFVLSPSAADASVARSAAHNEFGAIVMAPDGAIGLAYDYRTRAAAYSHATHSCKVHSSIPGQCRKIGWVRNACGAVAVKYDRNGYIGSYKYGYARYKRDAENAARRHFGGRIHGYVCTSR